MYTHSLRPNTYHYLSDTGFFTNRHQVEVMEQAVLPWLLGKVEAFVDQLDHFNQFPDILMMDHFQAS